jgi:YVTN family beta-propeller protein
VFGSSSRTLVRRHGTAGLAILVLACGGGGTDPEPIGAPVALSVSAGNEQTGGAGQPLLAPIAAKVSDANGRGVPNVPVAFRVVAGGGAIESISERTNGAGIATASWRLGIEAGRQERAVATLLDTLTGALLDTAIFTATVTAGPPAAVFPLSGSGVVIAIGQTTPVTLRALVRDAFGNPTPGATVTWQLVTGEGSLASPTTVSDAQGITTNSLTPSPSEGEIEVRASLGGTLGAAAFYLTVRRVTARFAFLSGGGFGIARTPGGELIVSLIQQGQVERVPASPGASALASVGGLPVVVAVDPAGQLAYAANMGTGVLSVIDVASMTKVVDVDIPGEAHSLAMSPRGDRVYVTNTANSVFAVDVATRTIVQTTGVGSGPWGIAFWTTATDSLMYVTARDGGSISEIDMRTGNLLRTLSVGGRPHGIAIAPNGSTLYVADDSNGRVLFVNRATGAITHGVPATGAFGIAIAPDGSTLYVTTNPGYILVIDVPSATVSKQESTEGQPRQILVLPDGNTALAANLGGWVDMVTR